MNFNEYWPLALRTAKMFPTQRENMRHAILGLTTEIGEFATEVKRHVVYGKPLTDEMVAHMREELGDSQWYVPLALFALGRDELPTPTPEQLGSLPTDLADAVVFLGGMLGGLCAWYSLDDDVEAEDTYTLCQLLGGIVYVIDNVIAPAIGASGDSMRADNIDKLRLRFPEAYSDAAAEARADKGGLDARNS